MHRNRNPPGSWWRIQRNASQWSINQCVYNVAKDAFKAHETLRRVRSDGGPQHGPSSDKHQRPIITEVKVHVDAWTQHFTCWRVTSLQQRRILRCRFGELLHHSFKSYPREGKNQKKSTELPSPPHFVVFILKPRRRHYGKHAAGKAPVSFLPAAVYLKLNKVTLKQLHDAPHRLFIPN